MRPRAADSPRNREFVTHRPTMALSLGWEIAKAIDRHLTYIVVPEKA